LSRFFYFAVYPQNNNTYDVDINAVMKHCISSEFRKAMTSFRALASKYKILFR